MNVLVPSFEFVKASTELQQMCLKLSKYAISLTGQFLGKQEESYLVVCSISTAFSNKHHLLLYYAMHTAQTELRELLEEGRDEGELMHLLPH